MPGTRMSLLLSLALSTLCLAACAGSQRRAAAAEPPVDCQYATLPPRFCGASEEETLFRETHPDPVRVCNGCLTDEDCTDRRDGSCVELPGEGCSYSAFVCVYPGDPCHGERSGCAGTCVNREGRAACSAPAEPAPAPE